MREFVCCNAYTGIAHGHTRLGLCRLHHQRHDSSCMGVKDGVIQQIHDDLNQPGLVADDSDRLLVAVAQA